MSFREITPEAFGEHPFRLDRDLMLITAADGTGYNTMTAGWGGFGVVWKKPVAYIFVRKHRHTYLFLENADSFTLSFFDEAYKAALALCGRESGRDGDKAAKAGLTPIVREDGTVAFQEARGVLTCTKLYRHELDPDEMLKPEIDLIYPAKDYHVMYIGEVTKLESAE